MLAVWVVRVARQVEACKPVRYFVPVLTIPFCIPGVEHSRPLFLDLVYRFFRRTGNGAAVGRRVLLKVCLSTALAAAGLVRTLFGQPPYPAQETRLAEISLAWE